MFLKIVFHVAILSSSLYGSASAAVVTCNFNGNQCTDITSITQVTTANEAITVSGQLTTYTDATLTSIRFSSPNVLNYFPTNIFQMFSNIDSIILNNVQFTTLVTDAFNYCSTLTVIAINSNPNLTSIPAGFARNCINLRSVAFTSNGITNIDVNAFQGLINAINIRLSSNKLVTIPADLFKNTPAVEMIEMIYNSIQYLDANTFKGLVNLSFVDITTNQIACIPAFDLTAVSNNHFLAFYIGANPVKSIDPTFFTTLSSQRVNNNTNVSFNNATCLPLNTQITLNDWSSVNQTFATCFANYPAGCPLPTTTTASPTFPPASCSSNKICRYYLDYHNRYTCVIDGADSVVTSIAGTHLTPYIDASVTRVYFTNSFLTKVSSILFSKFTNLNFLSIANCSISIINDQTFNQCGSLTYLDARYNGIYRISETAFKNCTNLQTIDFTGNPIEFIDTKIYTLDPSLKKIIINVP